MNRPMSTAQDPEGVCYSWSGTMNATFQRYPKSCALHHATLLHIGEKEGQCCRWPQNSIRCREEWWPSLLQTTVHRLIHKIIIQKSHVFYITEILNENSPRSPHISLCFLHETYSSSILCIFRGSLSLSDRNSLSTVSAFLTLLF